MYKYSEVYKSLNAMTVTHVVVDLQKVLKSDTAQYVDRPMENSDTP